MKKVSAESLNNQVYNEIKQAIMSGQFRAGDKFTVRKLVEKLGTSQMPVRVALNRLLTEGALVQSVPSGTSILPHVTRAQFREWMELRSILEPRAAELAGPNMKPAIIRKLNKVLNKSKTDTIVDVKVNLLENYAFKHTIYEQCQSPTLLRFIDLLWLRVGPVFHHDPHDASGEASDYTYEENVIAALEKGDGATAGKFLKKDILDGMGRILDAAEFADD
ncbi:MAG: GntR family transcriptional regulator [Pseudomonadota bacterium]